LTLELLFELLLGLDELEEFTLELLFELLLELLGRELEEL
jgi:hypothetical protein